MSASATVEYELSTPRQVLFGYALRVRVTEASGMPKEIFTFQRGGPPAPVEGAEPLDVFTCIADPVDLHEVPALAPDLANEMPYYRLAEVTLCFRTMEERDSTKADIAADIQLLVRSINAMAVYTDTETVTYPVPGA